MDTMSQTLKVIAEKIPTGDEDYIKLIYIDLTPDYNVCVKMKLNTPKTWYPDEGILFDMMSIKEPKDDTVENTTTWILPITTALWLRDEFVQDKKPYIVENFLRRLPEYKLFQIQLKQYNKEKKRTK